MKRCFRFCLTIVCLLMLPALRGIASEYMVKPITLSDGLSQNSVKSILYDSNGYLWLGTKYGLNRYDHRKIYHYYADQTMLGTITDNDVDLVFEDARDSIWVACDKGLTRYDRRKNRFVPVKYGNRILRISSYCDTPRGLILGGSGRIYFYNYETCTLELVDTNGGATVAYNRIHRWEESRYLLETRWDGLWVYDAVTRQISRYTPCAERDIMSSLVDINGNLWVSPYDDGLLCYNHDGELIHEINVSNSDLSNDIVLDILEDDNRLWLATEKGVDIFDKETLKISHLDSPGIGPMTGTVLKLYKDDYGNIYAGTLRRGVLCIYTVSMQTYTGIGGDGPDVDFTVTSLYDGGDGTVWCGIDGGGVARLNPERNSFQRYASTAGKKVSWISAYDAGRLLISTFDEGFYLLDKNSGALSAAPQVYKALTTADYKKGLTIEVFPIGGNHDLAVNDEVYIIDRNIGSYHRVHQAFKSGKMTAFYHDTHRFLFKGERRILSYDIASDTMRPLVTFTQGVSVRCAQFDGYHTIYIGTNRGLYKYDTIDCKLVAINARFIRNINAMVLDGTRLWIGADNVLYLMKDGKLMIFNSYDGVEPNEFISKSYLLTPQYLLMGGINGLQKIDREMIDDMELEPENVSLALSDLIVDGVSDFARLSGGSVDIPSTHSSIEVRVIDREQNAMRSKLFRFYVDGLNRSTPIETFDRTIALNVLPSGGTYTVSVACSRADGSWTDPVEIVTIHVRQSWWKSWWAILIYVFFGAYVGYIIYRYTYRRKQRQLVELKHKTLEREVGFLSNINYELRTPLSLIYSPLKVLINRLKNNASTDPDTVRDLEQIYRHTKEMRDVINMPLELWHVESSNKKITPEKVDFNLWLHREIKASTPAIDLRHMTVSYSLDESIGNVTFDRTRMGIVLSNMLIAAVKHSPKGSTLSVSSKLNGDIVRVDIHDQGETLTDAEIKQVFSGHYNNQLYGAGLGLAYAKMLMDMQQGRIGVESNRGEQGVTIWLELPRELRMATATPDETDAELETVPHTDGGVVDVFDTSVSTAIVVEDNEELCMFMVSHLKGIFKKVYYAFNGRDALLMIKRDTPDIVIAEGVLPVLSGFDLCREMKSSSELRHIPIILITAGSAEAGKLKSYALGADSYISKPFDVNVLISRCKNLLLNREIVRNRYRNIHKTMPVEEKKMSNADESFLLKIDEMIESSISQPDFGVDMIVDKMLISRSALYSRFKELTGKSIGTYITEYRLARAKEMLRHGDLPINEISEALGFRSQRYFSTFFRERTGTTPTAYRTSRSDVAEVPDVTDTPDIPDKETE